MSVRIVNLSASIPLPCVSKLISSDCSRSSTCCVSRSVLNDLEFASIPSGDVLIRTAFRVLALPCLARNESMSSNGGTADFNGNAQIYRVAASIIRRYAVCPLRLFLAVDSIFELC